MSTEPLTKKNSPAVTAYIQSLRQTRNSYSDKSSQCKIWVVTLTCAVMTYILNSKLVSGSLFVTIGLAVIPILMFYFLNAYYTMKELNFDFLSERLKLKLNAGDESYILDLYDYSVTRTRQIKDFIKALIAPSVILFYFFFLCLIIALILVYFN